jgi:hypothetical protein
MVALVMPKLFRYRWAVLNDAIDGNGGLLPLIDDWQNIYQQLNCNKQK